MLELISVKGFRSLRDFSLEIRSGLNVLVGPNGAGKTNIILFFDFFRNVTMGSLADGVGRAGGVAQVFSKRGKNSFADKIQASINGRVKVDKITYVYSYKFEIQFSSARQEVFFSRQELLIEEAAQEVDKKVFGLHLIYRQPGVEEGSSLEILKNSLHKKNSWVINELKALSDHKFYAQQCFFSFLVHADEVCSAVSDDFSGRFILNVVPSHVKKPEDSTRKPGIDTDGSGLSATLYAIKKGRSFYDRSVSARPRKTRITPLNPQWNGLIDLIRVAVPSITDIDVENDPFDNLLRCRISVGKGNRKAVLPLSALSDGTVKWMSLVARLLTSREALLLEEPENYLHPLMQREIVRLLRGSVDGAGFMLVSTHSETLLNAVKPEELVLVSYDGSGTKAKRASNSIGVAEEINRTGFGLGYYYLADALEAE